MEKGNTTPGDLSADTGSIQHIIELLEHMSTLMEQQTIQNEAIIEALMRNYDALLMLDRTISGSRARGDGLRHQHLNGKYYFPPFSIADHDGLKEVEDD